MKNINVNILNDIRNYYIEENEIDNIQELAYYDHYEFIPFLASELSKNEDVDTGILEDVCLYQLCNTYEDGEVMDNNYIEDLITMRNNGAIPLGLSLEQFNTLDLGHYSWIEYGELNKSNNLIEAYYYDTECLTGVKKLFDLPYFKRQFTILEKYLNNKGLIKDSKIATTDINVISDFNNWFIAENNKYNSLVDCVNNLYLK